MPIAARAKTPSRVLAVAAVGLIALLSGCDAKAAPVLNNDDGAARQVTVVGTGEVLGTPDTLTIDAAMEVVAPDAAGALNQTSQLQRGVIDALVASGIDRKDINTSQVSVQPQYAGGDSSNINAYRASNTIDIKVRELNSASEVFGIIAGRGGNATRINDVTLAIEDDSQLVREARARAFNDAKSRAEQYALLAELDLGKVLSISEAPTSTPPTPYPGQRGPAAEMAAVPIEPGQQAVGFNVTVVYELT
ncbi:SIMPL domain-containing protein [Mycolicibacterium sp. ND9-15]|uniref:SIMPL domain-containing protein n=1 Tax=Mycolicibacterium sp. ND9-15 TaxID=3042320 RepID=UPI002DD8B865|nr:SIMPL domain-containing protein [Mycolicibacterium sp. ND9-15]WSE54575.1 SIMPL domain-containing protein [Mycolicibacterium sp. ND9-15]